MLIYCFGVIFTLDQEEASAIKAAGKAWYKTMISDSDYTEFENFTKWLGVSQWAYILISSILESICSFFFMVFVRFFCCFESWNEEEEHCNNIEIILTCYISSFFPAIFFLGWVFTPRVNIKYFSSLAAGQFSFLMGFLDILFCISRNLYCYMNNFVLESMVHWFRLVGIYLWFDYRNELNYQNSIRNVLLKFVWTSILFSSFKLKLILTVYKIFLDFFTSNWSVFNPVYI